MFILKTRGWTTSSTGQFKVSKKCNRSDWSTLPTGQSTLPPLQPKLSASTKYNNYNLEISLIFASAFTSAFALVPAAESTRWRGHTLEAIATSLSYCLELAGSLLPIRCTAKPAIDDTRSSSYTPCQRSDRLAYYLIRQTAVTMMPRESKSATTASAPTSQANPSIVVISNDGDILIQVKEPTTCVDRCYRCSRNVLRNASEYFNVLLDPVKFSEGIAVESRLQDLTRQYNNSATIPTAELPMVSVTDVGDLPKDCVSTSTVVSLFFNILHDFSTAWPVSRAESLNVIALLSIVADMFACITIVADYLIRQKLRTTLLKDRKSATAHKSELENRQKLLVGLIFGFPEWVQQCSATLIVECPTRPIPISSEDEDMDGDYALWWRLPGGVEGAFSKSFVR